MEGEQIPNVHYDGNNISLDVSECAGASHSSLSASSNNYMAVADTSELTPEESNSTNQYTTETLNEQVVQKQPCTNLRTALLAEVETVEHSEQSYVEPLKNLSHPSSYREDTTTNQMQNSLSTIPSSTPINNNDDNYSTKNISEASTSAHILSTSHNRTDDSHKVKRKETESVCSAACSSSTDANVASVCSAACSSSTDANVASVCSAACSSSTDANVASSSTDSEKLGNVDPSFIPPNESSFSADADSTEKDETEEEVIEQLVGALAEEIMGEVEELAEDVQELVELMGGEVSNRDEEFYRATPEVSSDEEDTRDEEEDSDDMEAGNPEEAVERPLVLRRHTSFQRELADAIVRLAPIDELQLLLRCGARVNEPVTQGLSPLHYAVWQRYPEAAELLIREGCDLNARDDIGYTPMHLCAEHGYLDMMKVLMSHNAKVNINQPEEGDLYPIDAVDEPLRLALKHDQMAAAKLLLDNNADPNGRYFFGSEINLVSPLQPDLVKLLLEYGARPDTRDRYGFTPIMKACHVQQEAEEQLEELDSISGSDLLRHFAETLKGIQSVLVLISHGADINIRTDEIHEYRSVLHYAILSGSSPIVDLLIKQGAKVNLEPEYNRASPLHLAVLKGDTGIMNMLLDSDAAINITTPTVGSPLHVACSEAIPNRMEVLKLLLERGANPNIVVRNESGRPLKPPLGEYLANATTHDVDVVKLLLRYGSKVIMQAPQQCPLGMLNCLYSVAKNKEVMIELLEAAEKFDVPLIRKTPMLVPSSHRVMFLDIAVNPSALRHLTRVFVREVLNSRRPEAVEELELPRLLHRYLLYEIN